MPLNSISNQILGVIYIFLIERKRLQKLHQLNLKIISITNQGDFLKAILLVRGDLHCVVSHNLNFGNKTARALKPGSVRDLFARARKGFMAKRILRHGCQDMIDLIARTYMKSLKVPLPLADPLALPGVALGKVK